MKRIFTLISCLAFAGLTNAQNLATPSATVTVTGFPSDAQLQALVTIENTSSTEDVDVDCERVELNVVPGSENSFCWGALCYPATTSISLFPSTIPALGADNTFRGDYLPQNTTGVTTINYIFSDANNSADAVNVTINYDTQTLGVNNLNNQNTFLNVSARPGNSLVAVGYNVSGTSNNQLKVYNLLGNNVKSFNLAKSGTMVVSTSGLSNGVYVFCLEANGKAVATKKLVVSK